MKNKFLIALFLSPLFMNSCTKDVADSVYDSIILHSDQGDFKAFASRTDGMVVLEGKADMASNLTVIINDSNGTQIHRTNWTLLPGINRTQVNLPELAEPGVYLIKIMDDSGDYQVVKVSLTY